MPRSQSQAPGLKGLTVCLAGVGGTAEQTDQTCDECCEKGSSSGSWERHAGRLGTRSVKEGFPEEGALYSLCKMMSQTG